VVQECLAL